MVLIFNLILRVLPAMEHPEPSSKELLKSCAESAVSELGALHKLK